MPEDRFAHLVLSRLVPVAPRRRHGGGGVAVRKYADVRQHGENIGRQLQETEGLIQRNKPAQFDPGLLMKIRSQPNTISDDALRSFGIEVISEETDETLVVFVSEQAKQEFLQRLDRYEAGESGRGVSANVFHAIEEISAWQRSDRIGRTLRSHSWTATDAKVVDIELWPRESRHTNRRECDQFVGWLSQGGAEIWDQLSTDSVVLIRARVTGLLLDQILEIETVRMIELPPVLYMEPTAYDTELRDIQIKGPSAEDTTAVTILDSGVIAGHPLIAPAMGEEVSYVPDRDPLDETGHGSAVAGFALYGDIEQCAQQQLFSTNLRIHSAKVLSGDRDEYDRRLIANQVIQAVDYFNGELGCRVFNISFGDLQQPYDDGHIRGLASILDELARSRNIIFVVSAGNFVGTDRIPADWKGDYPSYLLENDARILDPAPALNVITVGSLARYDADRHAVRYTRDVNYQPIARADEISPFSRTGPGPNGAIKPELVEYGGNLSVDLRTGGEPRFNSPDPCMSELALKHNYIGNRLFVPLIGTSFATPKVSNLAGRFLQEYPDASANLVRALLLLNASWPFPDNSSVMSDEQTFYTYGYGRSDVEKTLYSAEKCVTLIAEEAIGVNQTHFFEVPLPEDFLLSGRCERGLRVALAHCPPCRSTRKAYKGNTINFKVVIENNLETLAARFREHSDLENIAEWGGMRPGTRLRSRGSAMAAKKTIRLISNDAPLLNGKKLFIVVTHQVEDWASELVGEEESYALAVELEERQRESVQLYAQLRVQLRQRARARARV